MTDDLAQARQLHTQLTQALETAVEGDGMVHVCSRIRMAIDWVEHCHKYPADNLSI